MPKQRPFELKQVDEVRWEIPQTGPMNVPGVIYANENLIVEDESIDQVYNVSQMKGIIERSMAMPDLHSGYGFSIGGVAAFDANKGIVSPGGVN